MIEKCRICIQDRNIPALLFNIFDTDFQLHYNFIEIQMSKMLICLIN